MNQKVWQRMGQQKISHRQKDIARILREKKFVSRKPLKKDSAWTSKKPDR